MKKKTRKKTWRTLLGFLLCIFTMTVCVWADEGTSQNPDYVTDYYMLVESPEGGIDIYSEADPQSTKLNGELILFLRKNLENHRALLFQFRITILGKVDNGAGQSC